MARGWESKSVEEQIESATVRPVRGTELTPEQAERERKRDSLLLQRTRVLRELEQCQGDRHRKTLTDGLAYLESQLAEMGWRAQ